jgi:CubicO group peptidase (beta-lactamase class C family)
MKSIESESIPGGIHGFIQPGFEPVLKVFENNFRDHGDVGAACAIYHKGRCVVDLWGGFADFKNSKPWLEDTIALVFSAAKGPTATCINRLVEAGQLHLDLPIGHYWPEFACNGKENISTRMVLSHQAGLAVVEGDLTLAQVLAWHPVVEAIAAQAPVWEPGTAHGYHARSFGWILGELLRRITGESLGDYLNREIAKPLGLRYWVGLPEAQLPHCAVLIPPEGGSDTVAKLLGADSLTARVMSGPSGLFGYNEMWNSPEVLMAEMPSSNGVGDARSLARLYAAVMDEVDGVRLLGPVQLARACEEQVSGQDCVIFQDTRTGLGYGLGSWLTPDAGPNSFGHAGAGGALAFADPDVELGFSYIVNAMQFNMEGDPRSALLVKASYEALSKL